jgi:hypothetical protein
MKRSFMSVVAAATVLAFTACGGPEGDADIEPVENVQPAPAPAPMPEPLPVDTLGHDTLSDTIARPPQP